MGYKRLYKNLIDIIKEEQAKLGFRRESIRLYYPLSSLNHFFETQDTDDQMKNIIALIKNHDKNVFVEEIHNGEFDYLIRFSEENEDPYYYCFHDEGCHIIYHRFLPEDYEDFGF